MFSIALRFLYVVDIIRIGWNIIIRHTVIHLYFICHIIHRLAFLPLFMGYLLYSYIIRSYLVRPLHVISATLPFHFALSFIVCLSKLIFRVVQLAVGRAN